MLVRRLGFLLPLLIPLLILAGYRAGGAWNFLVVAWVFGLLPLLDLVVGRDRAPVVAADEPRAWARFFDGILYLWVPVQIALLVFAAGAFVRLADPVARLGLALSVGVATGAVGIVVAHELGHRRGRLDRALALVLLATVGYSHFYVEHNQGHHARVATPDDPATARAGESFWHFLPRTLAGSFASAWHLEVARLRSRGRPLLGIRNRVLWGALATLALAALFGGVGGAPGAAFFVSQAAVAVSLLEVVNYLEHYGLERRRRAGGGYEKVTPRHSWNSSERLTNWFTFNLQRHSHHHAHVTRHYESLEHIAGAPQLPTGYAGMVLLALIPPLWRRVMDPRLAAWRAAGTAP